jgi:hypothetical protein
MNPATGQRTVRVTTPIDRTILRLFRGAERLYFQISMVWLAVVAGILVVLIVA